MTTEDQVQQIELLTLTDDDQGGVIVEMDKPMDSATIVSILKASISHWKQLVDSEFVEALAFRWSRESIKLASVTICINDNIMWMPFDQYATQPFMEKYELLKYINHIYLERIDGQYSGFTLVSTTSNFYEKMSYLYLNVEGLKKHNSL
ncbi:Nudix hydrolase 2 [Spatholobus suberectus]|nr:Nudix hydrolase 2 [Spatholobus suberectus]